jgi:hypothetical protein
MITLTTGALPVRKAVGVFEVIQYLRSLGNFDDQFSDLPDEIHVPAVRISIPDLAVVQEIYGDDIILKILNRDPRSPRVMLCQGDDKKPGIILGESRMSMTANPFRDVKRIEEYEGFTAEDPARKYSLIKMRLEKMDVTFLKWMPEE